jgi:hypothetical protein
MAGISHHMTGWGGGGEGGAGLGLAFKEETTSCFMYQPWTYNMRIYCICLCMYYAICPLICNMQTKGGNGGRGEKVQHSSVGSMLACYTAGPSLNPGSALKGGFSC